MEIGYTITNHPGIFILTAAIASNFLAQFIKFVADRITTKKWHIEQLFTTGGMPSSHTAFVVSGLICVGITAGIDSALFAVTFLLTSVVLHDALGIRRQAGKQAAVLNNIVTDFLQLTPLMPKEYKLDNEAYNKKLKEFLGHEPIEVFGGVIFAIIVTTVVFFIFQALG